MCQRGYPGLLANARRTEHVISVLNQGLNQGVYVFLLESALNIPSGIRTHSCRFRHPVDSVIEITNKTRMLKTVLPSSFFTLVFVGRVETSPKLNST